MRRPAVVPAAALLLLLLAGPLAAQEFTESFTLDFTSLHVVDLIGEGRVLPAAGGGFAVEGAVRRDMACGVGRSRETRQGGGRAQPNAQANAQDHVMDLP